MIYRFPCLTSTNDEAQKPEYQHGDLIIADEQTAGRGQRGHLWQSPAGQNLLCSLVLTPQFLPAARQFSLLEAVALGLTDAIDSLGVQTRIKWTNDIYVGDRKIVGILIEHALSGAQLRRTVVGIGVNVNQTSFDPALPNPTSLRLETGRAFSPADLAGLLHTAILKRYDLLAAGDTDSLHTQYISKLWHLGRPQHFRTPDGHDFTATIHTVAPAGNLILTHPSGSQTEHPFRSLEFVL